MKTLAIISVALLLLIGWLAGSIWYIVRK